MRAAASVRLRELNIPRKRLVPGVAAGILVAAAVLAPSSGLFPTDAQLDLARQALYIAALAATWSFIAGVAGQMTFAHLTVAGIAAYVAAIWGTNVARGMGILGGVVAQMALGVFAAVLVGTALGLLLLRFRGTYLCLFTLAFAELVRIIVIAEKEITNGWLSLASPQLGLSSTLSYYLILAVLVVVLVAIYATMRSRFGLFLRAIREDTDAASAMAVDTVRLKVVVLAGTSLLVGLAGVVYYHTVPRLTPEVFDLLEMSLVVVYTVLGGLESPISAAIAGIALVFLLNALQDINVGPVQFEPGTWRYAVFGAVLVVILRVMPNGLIAPVVGWVSRGGRRRSAPVQTIVGPSATEVGQAIFNSSRGEAAARQAKLEVQGVTMRFGGLTALRDVSFSLDKPQIVGLIGPNGAGKTTLINVLTGYYQPSGGAVCSTASEWTVFRRMSWREGGLGAPFRLHACFAG